MRLADAMLNKLVAQDRSPYPWLKTWQGEVQTCQSSLKKDGIGWEAGCFWSTWTYGLEDLNGGRTETLPFFSSAGILLDDCSTATCVSLRAELLNGKELWA